MFPTGFSLILLVGRVELRLLITILIRKLLIMVYHKVPVVNYTHPLSDIIKHHSGVKFHFYADDTQLYMCVDPRKPGETDRALSTLSACVSNIKAWMSKNMLLLNDEKTEFVVAARQPWLLKTFVDVTITIGNRGPTVIKPSSCGKNLGVIFDSTMNMSNHVSSMQNH